MFKLPSFDTCSRIAKENEAFIHKIVNYKGFKFHLFNYLLAQYNDFEKPLDYSTENAFELRGLTFLEHEGQFKRYLKLHKFFNINQCKNYQYEDLVNLKIRSILDKRDGSMIRFIKLPNGEIVSCTKMDFDNHQTELANKLLKQDVQLTQFVNETLDNGLAAIFELTSGKLNRIVINYPETKLTLIQLRDENTGNYLDVHSNEIVKKYNINIVDKCPLYEHLSYYLKERETIQGIEGWVFTAEDELGNTVLYKVKTTDYMEKHNLMTDTLTKENKLVELILDEKVDDVLGELDKDDDRREVLINLSEKLSKFINNKVSLMTEFLISNYKGSKKDFSIEYRTHEYFNFVAKAMDLKDEGSIKSCIYLQYLNYVRKKTYRLENARSFLKENLNYNLMDHLMMIEDDE